MSQSPVDTGAEAGTAFGAAGGLQAVARVPKSHHTDDGGSGCRGCAVTPLRASHWEVSDVHNITSGVF